jgi:hypothetical protein
MKRRVRGRDRVRDREVPVAVVVAFCTDPLSVEPLVLNVVDSQGLLVGLKLGLKLGL